jgi:diguanylate cyclase (GGDEF)-like protein
VITPIFDKNHQPIYYLALSKDTSSVIQKTLSLELKAYHDALTGLFNREKFNEVLDYKIRFFNKVGPIFSMIVADIDNFKQINDVHGHAVGDEVLKSVATLFLGNLRNDDMVFRWGGEEFCFLIDADAERAAHVADLLRIKVANQAFANLNVGAVTISFGVTVIKAHESAEPLFVRADEALYAAKSSGKNTVVLR